MKAKKILLSIVSGVFIFTMISSQSYAANSENFENYSSDKVADYFNVYNRSYDSSNKITDDLITNYFDLSPINRGSEAEPDMAFNYKPIAKLYTEKKNDRLNFVPKDFSLSINKGEWAHISFDYRSYCLSLGGSQVGVFLKWTVDGKEIADLKEGQGGSLYNNPSQGLMTVESDGKYIAAADNTNSNGRTNVYKDKEAGQWHTYDFYIGGPTGKKCIMFIDGKCVSSYNMTCLNNSTLTAANENDRYIIRLQI